METTTIMCINDNGDGGIGLRRRRRGGGIGDDDDHDGAIAATAAATTTATSPTTATGGDDDDRNGTTARPPSFLRRGEPLPRRDRPKQSSTHSSIGSSIGSSPDVAPLSMRAMTRPSWWAYCPDYCDGDGGGGGGGGGGSGSGGNNARRGPWGVGGTPPSSSSSSSSSSSGDDDDDDDAAGDSNGIVPNCDEGCPPRPTPAPTGMPGALSSSSSSTSSSSSSLHRGGVVAIEHILVEYAAACRVYGTHHRVNPGVLAAIRFSLPTLRVSGGFFDADMLALAEVLLRHVNGPLRHVRRLDFTVAGREGREWGGHGRFGGGGSGKKGIRSHGAYALSRVLAVSENVEEVRLAGNRIGPYGSSAIFEAASRNPRLRTLSLRGCRIGERGALAFVDRILVDGRGGGRSGLAEVDLSACRMGYRGCLAIEEGLKRGRDMGGPCGGSSSSSSSGGVMIVVDMEGNMIFQEVMNCVTHGLGIILGTVGQYLLNRQVSGQPFHYTASCAVYSASVISLYASSTLYHSFFALRRTKFVFQVFDRCAIYLLIAGSYTPFLVIGLHHKPYLSARLLLFIWGCALSGILVEAFFRTWEYKGTFSLAMYLGMGWTCISCLPDLLEVLPMGAVGLLVAGGVAYTGGV
jgi:hemolysin III